MNYSAPDIAARAAGPKTTSPMPGAKNCGWVGSIGQRRTNSSLRATPAKTANVERLSAITVRGASAFRLTEGL